MTATKKLLELFRVDKQLRGLRNRLEAAERFYNQQAAQLAELEKQLAVSTAQLKQLKASISNEDGEAARLDVRINTIREQMNSAKTSKEYNAFQTELNNYKAEKAAAEEREMDAMQKADEIEKKIADLQARRAESSGIVTKAKAERDEKEADIKDRVNELAAQRQQLAAGIAAHELRQFEELVKLRGDEAMASVEVLDRRNHEYSCTACMMAVPIETASAIMQGRLVNCPNCRCLLYIEESAEAETTPKKKGKGKEVTQKA